MVDHTMTLEDMQAVAAYGEALEPIAQFEGKHYLTGEVRIWNNEGWSPGYFTFEDDWVLFHADYKEQE